MVKNGRSALAILSLSMLLACDLRTQWNKPPPPIEAWQNINSDSSKAIDHEWWKQFHDETLNTLVKKARERSPDVAIALARIEQARALQSGTLADQLPNINADIGVSRNRVSTAVINNPNITRPYSTIYNAQFDATWEINLFGIAPALRAAKAFTAIAQANYDAALITLSGDVARTYFNIRMAQAQIGVTKKNITAQSEAVKLTKDLYNSGKVSNLDVAQAQTLLASTKATLAPLQDALKENMYQLDILIGYPPGAFDKELAIPSKPKIPNLDTILATPANVLAGRPDVKAAERNVEQAAALHDVALSQYFPKIPLAALIGYESSNLPFRSSGLIWSLGAGLTAPVFDFGRIRAQVRQASASGAEAMAQYEKTVLAALNDVESALIAYKSEQQHYQALSAAVDASRIAVKLSEERYRMGLDSYLNVITAQRALYETENNKAQSQLQLCINLVRLFKAME